MKIVIPTLMLILCLGCDSQQVAGSGSQTGNSVVAGRIAPTDSVANVAGVRVYLRPLHWTVGQGVPPEGLDSTWTDALGNYRFDSVPADTYRVEARRPGYGWSRTVRADKPEVMVDTGGLLRWGRLVVDVELNDSTKSGWLEFYGLARSLKIPDTGKTEFKVTFDSLPVGLQTLRIWSHDSSFCDAAIRIGPDSTSSMDYEHLDGRPEGPREDR